MQAQRGADVTCLQTKSVCRHVSSREHAGISKCVLDYRTHVRDTYPGCRTLLCVLPTDNVVFPILLCVRNLGKKAFWVDSQALGQENLCAELCIN